MTTNSSDLADEIIAPGLRYSEELKTVRTHQVRYCYLWQEGEEAPVSELEVHSFQQRFGAVVVPAEGIGGVETPPQFRQRGYLRQLLQRATVGMAQRVAVAFVGDGIEDMYEKYGYHTCLAEGHLLLNRRNIARLTEQHTMPANSRTVRTNRPADLPAMVDLYNAAHAGRPWTHLRPADWNRLFPVQTWKPGSTALVVIEGEQIVGYAIYNEHFYGWQNATFIIDELTALDRSVTVQLILEMDQLCGRLHLEHFTVCEPVDSMVGFVARQFGGEYHQRFPTTGGMMGVILHREALLKIMEPELRRRLPNPELLTQHAKAFPALLHGKLLHDDPTLLRLLLGDWSLMDAQRAGVVIPPDLTEFCAAWFPGGGTQFLPLPYAHKLDRY